MERHSVKQQQQRKKNQLEHNAALIEPNAAREDQRHDGTVGKSDNEREVRTRSRVCTKDNTRNAATRLGDILKTYNNSSNSSSSDTGTEDPNDATPEKSDNERAILSLSLVCAQTTHTHTQRAQQPPSD
jgi:hypothetical protein